ncbi:putative oxidoreductase C-terminal domain-containing protein [Compostibacter hankyongensis]|uniref:Oxidoreductase C-terminal domain-containing protein n=1 Tax=Compostibacter hankyongensis TaxID=1007089 RepID=A0ABP8FIN5_9BACT
MIRYRTVIAVLLMSGLAAVSCKQGNTGEGDFRVKLITLDPGHFHAALVQKSMYPQIDSVVQVYAPEGPELQAQLDYIKQYNTRAEDPTHWVEQVYTGKDFLEKMVEEKKGNVVVMAGNNHRKTEYIKRTVDAGMNVLGDKPMAIDTAGFNLLLEAFREAPEKKVLLYDIMTERSEITTILQRMLMHMPEVFGTLQPGTVDSPGVEMQSVHFFYKRVSGNVLTRPAWFFDPRQEGDAIVDVGTHLADLVQWECFPDSVLNYREDIRVLRSRKWPTNLGLSQFSAITKQNAFPDYLSGYVTGDTLHADANGSVDYTLKDIHVRISPLWHYQAPEGSGDTHFSRMRGTRATLEIRQGEAEQYVPALYVIPADKKDAAFAAVLEKAVGQIGGRYPGVGLKKTDEGWTITIPEKYRVGHEAHFAQVMERFLQYLEDGKIPEWELQGMIAKYYLTTSASAMASTPGK